jgi:carboxyl-terminal processing protease
MALYSKYLLFDYATTYRREHPTLPSPGDFEVNDSVFNAFVAFISDKKYDYKTKTEEALEDLRKDAEKENYFNAIKPEYEALRKQMDNDKKSDLTKFKSQIGELLKQEIVSRYYFQKGKIISSLKSDKDIAEASKTLLNQELYRSILAGTYKQPGDITDKKTGDDDSDEEDDPGNN